jgi:hypothetical protein
VIRTVLAFNESYGAPTDAVPLDYPAASTDVLLKPWRIGEYATSIREGIDGLKMLLATRAVDCPGQGIVLFGYSQGALVINQALNELPSATLSRVARVGLVADPARVGWSAVNFGSASYRTNGIAVDARIAPERDLPQAVRARAESLCDDGDPICAYTAKAAKRGGSVHGSYANGGSASEAAWQGRRAADRMLRLSFNPSPPTTAAGGKVSFWGTCGPRSDWTHIDWVYAHVFAGYLWGIGNSGSLAADGTFAVTDYRMPTSDGGATRISVYCMAADGTYVVREGGFWVNAP